MTTETRESDPPRFISYEGFSFLAISAAISLFSVASFLIVRVAGPQRLPPRFQEAAGIAYVVTFLAALAHSLLALVVLLVRGLAKSGSLALGRWHCSGTALGALFLNCYLAPWGALVVMYFSTGILL